jgi:acyl carrier protein phosphodiesterase
VNFLAHLWLADRTGTSLPGAVLGDVARGRDLSAYPEPIAQGIRLHRRIDAATDRHPHIAALRAGFAPGQRRYAGIVLDLAADHALAVDWTLHHPLPIEQFCATAARQLEQASQWFERAGGRAIHAQMFTQLLLSYAEPAGIERAVRRTAARLRQPAPLLAAAAHWQQTVAPLRALMPQLLDELRATAAER